MAMSIEIAANPMAPMASAIAKRLSNAATSVKMAKPPMIGTSFADIEGFDDAGGGMV
jgi:hypothetical protein